MEHEFSLVFDTDSELWKEALQIIEKNQKYPKKKVSNRHLHHVYPRSFSKHFGEPVDNDSDNLISLSVGDHLRLHWIYYKIARKGFKQPMSLAFLLMAKKALKYMSKETADSMASDIDNIAGKKEKK